MPFLKRFDETEDGRGIPRLLLFELRRKLGLFVN
jgi:hypothetical protein